MKPSIALLCCAALLSSLACDCSRLDPSCTSFSSSLRMYPAESCSPNTVSRASERLSISMKGLSSMLFSQIGETSIAPSGGPGSEVSLSVCHLSILSLSSIQRKQTSPSSSSSIIDLIEPRSDSLCPEFSDDAGISSDSPAFEQMAEPYTRPRFNLDATVLIRSLSLPSRISSRTLSSSFRGSRDSGGGEYRTPFFSTLLAYVAWVSG